MEEEQDREHEKVTIKHVLYVGQNVAGARLMKGESVVSWPKICTEPDPFPEFPGQTRIKVEFDDLKDAQMAASVLDRYVKRVNKEHRKNRKKK